MLENPSFQQWSLGGVGEGSSKPRSQPAKYSMGRCARCGVREEHAQISPQRISKDSMGRQQIRCGKPGSVLLKVKISIAIAENCEVVCVCGIDEEDDGYDAA